MRSVSKADAAEIVIDLKILYDTFLGSDGRARLTACCKSDSVAC